MPIMESKRSMLITEVLRLATAAKPNDTVLDLNFRRSPGPISDVEIEEFVASLTEKLDGRSFFLLDKANRILGMTARNRG